jgi:hypothetical protein
VSAVGAVLLARLADESAIFLPFGALESFRADLGLTYAQGGTVLAAIAPGALVGGVFPAAADRYSRRVISAGGAFVGIFGGVLAFTVLARRFEGVDDYRLLLASVTAMAAGAVAIAVVPVLAVTAGAGLVTAIGLSLAWLAVQHRSLRLRPGQVGTTNAVHGAISSAGAFLPMAIGALADRAGLTWAVGSFGIVGGVLVALTWWDGRRRRAVTPA